MTPRGHFVTALVTVGEGYHNFHHQFPMDYRNAAKWYQYDPTKWFIATMSFLGLASHLHVFPDNEVRKGRLAMELQKLHESNRDITWPTSANHLPVISWSDYQAEAKTRPLIVVSGFIHDVGSFIETHREHTSRHLRAHSRSPLLEPSLSLCPRELELGRSLRMKTRHNR
ncbi:unnamed protein product [Tilletia controversa]|nr:unnamed protein product [Tilletia controversa]CAD6979777.1 unnamed protein product [Tilletia controversa]